MLYLLVGIILEVIVNEDRVKKLSRTLESVHGQSLNCVSCCLQIFGAVQMVLKEFIFH